MFLYGISRHCMYVPVRHVSARYVSVCYLPLHGTSLHVISLHGMSPHGVSWHGILLGIFQDGMSLWITYIPTRYVFAWNVPAWYENIPAWYIHTRYVLHGMSSHGKSPHGMFPHGLASRVGAREVTFCTAHLHVVQYVTAW
jgi:hypothetical protein